MQINVSTNIKELTKELSRAQKDQIPFAASQTVNQLAFEIARNVLPKKTTEVFQGGATPFTQKAFKYTRSNKRNLISKVFVDEARQKYMKFMIAGGTRFPDRRAILVATDNSKLNKYGNIPRGTLQQMVDDKTKESQKAGKAHSTKVSGNAMEGRAKQEANASVWSDAIPMMPSTNHSSCSLSTLRT